MPAPDLVFVVEDNVDNMMIVERLLKRDVGGLEFVGRESGADFFTWIDANPDKNISLILLDIQIPREDGYVVLQQIRQHPKFQATQVKVVAITANVLPPDVERCRQAGFDGFIGKPIVRERFPEQIRRILRGEEVWEVW